MQLLGYHIFYILDVQAWTSYRTTLILSVLFKASRAQFGHKNGKYPKQSK